MGVWLPLALADIMALLYAVIRMNAAKPDEVKIPSRYEALSSWCLPMMAKAIKADEDERAAIELLESVKRLKKRFEQ